MATAVDTQIVRMASAYVRKMRAQAVDHARSHASLVLVAHALPSLATSTATRFASVQDQTIGDPMATGVSAQKELAMQVALATQQRMSE